MNYHVNAVCVFMMGLVTKKSNRKVAGDFEQNDEIGNCFACQKYF
jgi:hypothetical protein